MATTAETAHSKLYTLLYNEFTNIPTPVAYVYEHHGVADLALNAITVELLSIVRIDTDRAMNQSEIVEGWKIDFSVHIHTAYYGGVYDPDVSNTLTDDVTTLLWDTKTLDDGYRVFEVAGMTYRIEFDDSKTIGCEIRVTIIKVETYAS